MENLPQFFSQQTVRIKKVHTFSNTQEKIRKYFEIFKKRLFKNTWKKLYIFLKEVTFLNTFSNSKLTLFIYSQRINGFSVWISLVCFDLTWTLFDLRVLNSLLIIHFVGCQRPRPTRLEVARALKLAAERDARIGPQNKNRRTRTAARPYEPLDRT